MATTCHDHTEGSQGDQGAQDPPRLRLPTTASCSVRRWMLLARLPMALPGQSAHLAILAREDKFKPDSGREAKERTPPERLGCDRNLGTLTPAREQGGSESADPRCARQEPPGKLTRWPTSESAAGADNINWLAVSLAPGNGKAHQRPYLTPEPSTAVPHCRPECTAELQIDEMSPL